MRTISNARGSSGAVPGGSFHAAYEAGFFGYTNYHMLNDLGIKNIVINAADIPASQKDKL